MIPIFKIEEISKEMFFFIYNKSFVDNKHISVDDLRLLTLAYYKFNNEVTVGKMIVNNKVASEVIAIFKILFANKYQIEKIRLIEYYNADDERSMDDNNSYCFCYRNIASSDEISLHALGLAIDINPVYNPYVLKDVVKPSKGILYANRQVIQEHMIDENDLCYKAFKEYGWQWGGHFTHCLDYHHFCKKL